MPRSVTPSKCLWEMFKLTLQGLEAPSTVSEAVTATLAVERERKVRLERQVAAVRTELNGIPTGTAGQ